jgi:hypothetical protein
MVKIVSGYVMQRKGVRPSGERLDYPPPPRQISRFAWNDIFQRSIGPDRILLFPQIEKHYSSIVALFF